MVLGRAMAVTAVPRVSQWAETHRIALGRGSASAILRQVSVTALVSRAMVGLPWPKKTTGMGQAAGSEALDARIGDAGIMACTRSC